MIQQFADSLGNLGYNWGMMPGLLANPAFFMPLIIWVMAWKGAALWKAAGRKELFWFIALLIVNTLGLLEIIYIFWFAKRRKGGTM